MLKDHFVKKQKKKDIWIRSFLLNSFNWRQIHFSFESFQHFFYIWSVLLKDNSNLDFATISFNPRLFSTQTFQPWTTSMKFSTMMFSTMISSKLLVSAVSITEILKFYKPNYFNPMAPQSTHICTHWLPLSTV